MYVKHILLLEEFNGVLWGVGSCFLRILREYATSKSCWFTQQLPEQRAGSFWPYESILL
jgi:hypothetical protein